MNHSMRHILGLAAGCLILVAASAQSASAQPPLPMRPNAPSGYVPNRILPLYPPRVYPPNRGNRPVGGDWWRTYPRSPYNAWRYPSWYPPYIDCYPHPPIGVYPHYPLPHSYPWGGINFGDW